MIILFCILSNKMELNCMINILDSEKYLPHWYLVAPPGGSGGGGKEVVLSSALPHEERPPGQYREKITAVSEFLWVATQPAVFPPRCVIKCDLHLGIKFKPSLHLVPQDPNFVFTIVTHWRFMLCEILRMVFSEWLFIASGRCADYKHGLSNLCRVAGVHPSSPMTSL